MESKKKKTAEEERSAVQDIQQKVRGSGYTYDEETTRTDEPKPVSDTESEDIIRLPDLGAPNRP